ncbi:hypothetical protein IQ13_1667 [Lacibacter cauensis]|uniref:Uncharacterized protein n=1 Tax=Lacibacter cauensis TaxID=510947 RepID=A0A562SQM4_9BACT|nr:hypothetical protein [Lacibacter cauensis]TWI83555.1 hypothetical protein IQ13_1667 [Lacibacter cauensis]
MTDQNQTLETIKDIRNIMDRSSRFLSLSGLSGVGAGVCALAGAWFANDVIAGSDAGKTAKAGTIRQYEHADGGLDMLHSFMGHRLFMIAAVTLISAIVVAVIFTYLRSSRQGIPLWSSTSQRLIWNVAVPLVAGGLFLLKLIEAGVYGLIAPGCLIFYGLALVNGAKYTLGEIRFLGYGMLLLGIISCWFPGYGLYFWAAGFGLLHIIYGIVMWNKYERQA